jgi:PAS domain S-box-containing protein
LCAALLGLGCLFVLYQYDEYIEIEVFERDRLSIQAKIIDELAEARLKAIYLTLDEIRRDESLWHINDQGKTHYGHLKIFSQALLGVRTLSILDIKGKVIASSQTSLIGEDLSGRQYFQNAQKNFDPSMLYVSRPLRTIRGAFAIILARALIGPNGEFAGVVSASLEPGYFERLLDSVRYSTDMFSAIVHGEGELFAVVPRREGMSELNLARPGTMFSRHLGGGLETSVIKGIVYATGDERIAAWRTIRPVDINMDQPLVAVVSRNLSDLYSIWRRDTSQQGALFVIICFISFISLSFYQKRQKQILRLVGIIETASDAIISAELNGVISSWNLGAETLFGYTADEIIGRSIHLLLREDQAEIELQILAQVKEGRAISQLETVQITKNGSQIDVTTTYSPLRDNAGCVVGISMITSDITERKSMERELYHRSLELTRSNEDLEQFAYVASHDLQEPLRMMASYVELLAKRYGGAFDERADKYIRYTVEGAKRMQELIDDLLAYSRIGTHGTSFQKTDCTKLVETIIKDLAISIRDAEAKIEVANPLPIVNADPSQLRQVFQNIISNAIKFHGADKPYIRIHAESNNNEHIFTVEDNGIGIDKEFYVRVFVIFQHLHGRDAYPGTGIGLAIAKRIVERHGGRIWVESQPGKGSKFRFSIFS